MSRPATAKTGHCHCKRMTVQRSRTTIAAAAIFAAAAPLAGCLPVNDPLLPILAGENRAGDPNSGGPPADGRLRLKSPPSGTPVAEHRRPLVVIRFVNDDIGFETPLYREVSRALSRDPALRLDLVAVTPSQADAGISGQAATYGGRVLRSLAAMGFPSERIRMSAVASSAAAVTEVHLYVR